MATQAINTILSTIGGAERLDTSTAERVAQQESARKYKEAEDLVTRQREQMKALNETLNTKLPPTMKRKISEGYNQLQDDIATGELTEQDINRRIAELKNERGTLEQFYVEQTQPVMADYLKNPSAKILTDGEKEITEEGMKDYFNLFFGDDKVFEEDDYRSAIAYSQGLQNYEEIDPSSINELIKNYYDINKDSLANFEDAGSFLRTTTTTGLQPQEQERLKDFLINQNSPQLRKMAARRGMNVNELADQVIGSMLPVSQIKEEVKEDIGDRELRVARGKQRLDTPKYSVSVGESDVEAEDLPKELRTRLPMGGEGGRNMISISRTLKSGKENRQTVGGATGTFGRLYYSPEKNTVAFEFIPVEESSMSIKAPAQKDGKVVDGAYKTKTTRLKQGDEQLIYANPNTGENMDILGQYLEDTGLTQEEFYEQIGFTPQKESTSAEKAQELINKYLLK